MSSAIVAPGQKTWHAVKKQPGAIYVKMTSRYIINNVKCSIEVIVVAVSNSAFPFFCEGRLPAVRLLPTTVDAETGQRLGHRKTAVGRHLIVVVQMTIILAGRAG